MEFPAEWAVFQSDEFDTAAPRYHGKAVMDPGEAERKAPGSLSHRYRRLRDFGGQVSITNIISNAELEGVTAQFQFWGRDTNLRRTG
jgi:hypothetical protein